VTTLVDIYEAAGFEVTEDRTRVMMSGVQQMRPFDIVLRVVPTGVAFDYEGQEKVTFSVQLHDGYRYDGGAMIFTEYGFEMALPVDQVRILPPNVSE